MTEEQIDENTKIINMEIEIPKQDRKPIDRNG